MPNPTLPHSPRLAPSRRVLRPFMRTETPLFVRFSPVRHCFSAAFRGSLKRFAKQNRARSHFSGGTLPDNLPSTALVRPFFGQGTLHIIRPCPTRRFHHAFPAILAHRNPVFCALSACPPLLLTQNLAFCALFACPPRLLTQIPVFCALFACPQLLLTQILVFCALCR